VVLRPGVLIERGVNAASTEHRAEIASTAGRLVCDRHLAEHTLSMKFNRTEYTFGSQATIERPCAEVRHWLVTPRLMPKWIVGLDAVVSLSAPVDVVGALILLDFGPGAGTPGTFRGEILEIGETSLVRRYRPSFGADAYERTVRYDLRADPAGSQLSCTIHTMRLNPGIEVRPTARRKELQHLERSLGRLRALVEGREERSLLRRILDGPTTPHPLAGLACRTGYDGVDLKLAAPVAVPVHAYRAGLVRRRHQ
jgi:hypothetical protein